MVRRLLYITLNIIASGKIDKFPLDYSIKIPYDSRPVQPKYMTMKNIDNNDLNENMFIRMKYNLWTVGENIIWRENMPNNLMLNSLYTDFTEIRVQIWRKFNIKIDEMHLTWGYNKTPAPWMPGTPKFRVSLGVADIDNPCVWARMQTADSVSDWLYCYDSKLPAHERDSEFLAQLCRDANDTNPVAAKYFAHSIIENSR